MVLAKSLPKVALLLAVELLPLARVNATLVAELLVLDKLTVKTACCPSIALAALTDETMGAVSLTRLDYLR